MSSITDGEAEQAPAIKFDRPRHIGYFSHCLLHLPQQYEKLDTNRLTLVHFCVHALDLLGVWDDADAQRALQLDKSALVEWIYSLQISSSNTARGACTAGFKGGTFLGEPPPEHYNHGHIAMTYTALATLHTLGDNLSRVNRHGIVEALRSTLQLPNGSFQCVAVGSEHDTRFLYCACCISHMLNDWSGVNVDAAVSYIKACRSWDGGFALLPGQEGHGGSTFCAVASLLLLKQNNVIAAIRKDLIRWCVSRQLCGMQGRPNKVEDTCYSYWIGGTLRLIGEDSLLDQAKLRSFVMKCQTKMGGFGKTMGVYPDVLHSFYSMAYLSLSQTHFDEDPHEVHLKSLDCTLGICSDSAALFD